MFEEIVNNVRQSRPLVHCITNYVTVNDCANILLAAGASPIMADDIAEVREITTICNALAVNIGTLNNRTIASMLEAGKAANILGRPAVLDPVGAGASALRTDTAFRLIDEVKFAVIRGNISEIKAVSRAGGAARGVDADVSDAVTEENLAEVVRFAWGFCQQTGAVIAITGAIDLVSDAQKTYVIRNGHPMMPRVTGTGCMLTALIGAFCGANPENILDATAAAVAAMGLCGEIAHQRSADAGTGTFRVQLIDAMSRMDAETLNGGIKIEIR